MGSLTIEFLLIVVVCFVSIRGSPVAQDLPAEPRGSISVAPSPPEVYKCLKENGFDEKVVDKFIETDLQGFVRLDLADDKNFCMYACHLTDKLGKVLSRELKKNKSGREIESKCKAQAGSTFCTYSLCALDNIIGVRHNALIRLTLSEILPRA